ncbi:hypothetical protein BT96DRAFT_1001736 [Gymnopus androsaceus JB14]|uniref:Uncharacterized protein n=1 Tax=Gymnopus androsaceus JB14 TaxID=1447944 RepID=A0A6A4H075_9AGAR|nr:hypothetical protein BT96DRAFT_1001736 [Gymnopus androsaceus JB14]
MKSGTKELPKEAAARNRRAKPKSNTAAKAKDKSPVKLRRKKKFNNSTAKTHLLGYFPMAVKYFGTLDSYDTRIGESEHRVSNGFTSDTRRRHALRSQSMSIASTTWATHLPEITAEMLGAVSSRVTAFTATKWFELLHHLRPAKGQDSINLVHIQISSPVPRRHPTIDDEAVIVYGFAGIQDSAAFDFLDLLMFTERAILSLPLSRQYEYLTPQGKREVEPDDWSRYYVNMFPDRDTFALFLGGGIGHQHLREHLREFAIDAGLTVTRKGDESSSSNEELDEEDVLSDNSDGSLDDDEEDPADDDEEDPADDAEGWLGPEDGEERTEEDVDEELGL